jgi:hypothetical protein
VETSIQASPESREKTPGSSEEDEGVDDMPPSYASICPDPAIAEARNRKEEV